MQPIHRLGALLQELRELRARQDRLRLAERLDFLVAGRLPDVEVLQREVARPRATYPSLTLYKQRIFCIAKSMSRSMPNSTKTYYDEI